MVCEKFPSTEVDFSDFFSDFIELYQLQPTKEHLNPLFFAVRDLVANRTIHRKKHKDLAYHLYFTLSPAKRDSVYLARFTTILVARLQTPHPPINHYIYETDEIGNLWHYQTQVAPQPDTRRARSPMHFLKPASLQYDLKPDEEAIFVDEETNEVVAMVCRQFVKREIQQVVDWVDGVVVEGASLKQNARVRNLLPYPVFNCNIADNNYVMQKEDPGKIVQVGYSSGSRSKPTFDWARNLLSKKYNSEDIEKFDHMCSSVFALFWNISRRVLHPAIIHDFEKFLSAGMVRMDGNQKGRGLDSIYHIKFDGQEHEFHAGELAPPVGFFSVNYARYGYFLLLAIIILVNY